MIHQLYLKQVEAWKERFPIKHITMKGDFNSDPQTYTEQEIRKTTQKNRVEDLLSSRHKDTIELLEAEIERKRGMRRKTKTQIPDRNGVLAKALDERDIPTIVWHYQHTLTDTYNSAIDEDTAYLEEQLKLIKKEI